MAVNVDIDLGYEFAVKAPFKDVFEVLSDVPTSASFFPEVDKLTDLGDNSYRWAMKKVGTAQVNLQTVYACRYTANKAKGSVTWIPVKGEGNAQISGSWKIVDRKDKTTGLEFKVNGSVEVPLPGLMKMVVVPVVKGEFEKLVEKYIDNLIKRFGGEAD